MPGGTRRRRRTFWAVVFLVVFGTPDDCEVEDAADFGDGPPRGR